MSASIRYNVESISAQLMAAHGFDSLNKLIKEHQSFEVIDAVLEEAARFSESYFEKLNKLSDASGCVLSNGSVKTAPGHKEAWEAFRENGWPTLDKPVEHGGQDLPLVAWAACQEIFDRGCVSFGMLPSAQAASVRLLHAYADRDLQSEWLPKLSTGEWSATICISESDAGSDVGRIRTLARPTDDGAWSITGEKIWISFGDHDLAPRIGHCLLARTPDAPAGGAGLSLFLTPNRHPDGSENHVFVRRIEEKLGLHGSPTCALGFEGARGVLIGKIGRGVSQLFAMIAFMRLSVGVQGLGIAAGAAQTAFDYAAERRQGGPANRPPIPIDQHADIQRLLLRSISRVEVLRGLVYATAVHVDLASLEPDADLAAESAALTQWLLPIVKTLGGETATDVANDAIQILGGSGYVREWGVEQALRDGRIFTIYEGATGMQALDLVHRRLWRDNGVGLKAFLKIARSELSADSEDSGQLAATLDLLEQSSAALMTLQGHPRDAEAGATHFLNLAGLAATGWIALRLARMAGQGVVVERLRSAGRYWLSDLLARATLESAQALAGAQRLELFSAFKAL